jgi:hypothetical protein
MASSGKPRSPDSPAQEVVRAFREDSALRERLKTEDPINVIQETANKVEAASWQGDQVLYRVAIGVLGSLALIAAIGAIVLVAFEKTTPEVLVSLGSAAVGALVGLFAPAPTK